MSNECLICLDFIDYENKDIPVLKCSCKGTYHDKCLNEWFIAKQSIICPICLQEFNDNHIIVINASLYRSSCINCRNRFCNLDFIICIFKVITLISFASVVFYLMTYKE